MRHSWSINWGIPAIYGELYHHCSKLQNILLPRVEHKLSWIQYDAFLLHILGYIWSSVNMEYIYKRIWITSIFGAHSILLAAIKYEVYSLIIHTSTFLYINYSSYPNLKNIMPEWNINFLQYFDNLTNNPNPTLLLYTVLVIQSIY